MNKWVVRLMVSRTDEGSVPRGSGLTDDIVMEQSKDSNVKSTDGDVIRLGIDTGRPHNIIDEEEDSDDEFDDDEGTLLFNSDAISHVVETNVFSKLHDYSVDSGILSRECLLVALYVGYVRLTQPNNFNRIMSKGKGWMGNKVVRNLEGIVKKLGESRERGRWEEVMKMQGLLMDTFNFCNFM